MQANISRFSRFHSAAARLRLLGAPLASASVLGLLVAAVSGCGDEAASDPQGGVASQMPAAMNPPSAPAQNPPPAGTPPAETPPPNTPPASEAPPGMVPLQPEPPPQQGGGMGNGQNNPPAMTPPAMTPPAMTPPMMTPPAMTPPAMTPPDNTPPDPPEPPAFAPCPTDGPCAIMPLGDSITFGIGAQTPVAGQGGYRVELFRRALADDHEINFVGRVVNGPTNVDGQAFPRAHEGYSGSTINDGGNQLANRVDAAIDAGNPNIILLMIGTNDVNGNQNNPPSDLGNLLDQITDAAPDALLVVAQIVPTQQAAINMRVQAYNATIPGLVQERVADGKHILMVDMFSAFVNRQGGANGALNDLLHPNDAGYVLMANTWYAAIEPFLP